MQPLDDEERKLAESGVEAAQRIADRYARLLPRYAEEFASTARWGALRAAKSYECKRSTFDVWVKLCVRSEIRNFLGGPHVSRKSDLTDEMINGLRSNPPDYVAEESNDHLKSLFARLPKLHEQICSMVYFDGLSPYSAGQSLGFTGGYGCNVHKEALTHLKGYLDE